MRKTYIIAEAGVNHNGSLDLARQLIDVAADAGADAVKFQTFRADALVTRSAPKAAYQQETTAADEAQWDMLRALELHPEDHPILMEHARQRNIQFLSTPFDRLSLDVLMGLGMPILKLPSGEVINGPLLLHAARTGRPLILSTGMSTLGEVEAALGVLAFGYVHRDEETPSLEAFAQAFASAAGQNALRAYVTLLHCTTAYPTPFEAVNLRAMDTLREAFGLRVGYSDHTIGISVPLAAVARGATVIEKHFTLDRTLPGPDHQASLEPDELQAMVSGIREVEHALGDVRKAPAAAEWANRPVVRKSLVTTRPVQAGETWSAEMLTPKRPGTGCSPMQYWSLLGKPADRDYPADTVVNRLVDLEPKVAL